jgi:hypothetical protein
MLIGNMWVNIKKMAKDGSMQVEMSQAVAGIKGTTFVVEETGSTSTLKVIEGTVEFTSLVNGAVAEVTSEQQVVASASGLAAAVAFDTTLYQNDSKIAHSEINGPDSVPTNTTSTKQSINQFLIYGIVAFLLIGLITIFLVLKSKRK